jgi:hypothetical protein
MAADIAGKGAVAQERNGVQVVGTVDNGPSKSVQTRATAETPYSLKLELGFPDSSSPSAAAPLGGRARIEGLLNDGLRDLSRASVKQHHIQ